MKRYALPFFLALIFATVGIATIGDYGINWDEPHRLLRGQAFVEFFLTRKTSYGLPDPYPDRDRVSPDLIRPGEYVTRYDFLSEEQGTPAMLPARPRPQAEFFEQKLHTSFFQHDAWNGAYFLHYDPFEMGHPPLPELLGALSNRIFYQWLRVTSDIDSYHIPYILISSIGVFVVSAFVLDLVGSPFAALIAGLALGLYPIYWAEAHFNLKDPLVAALFAGAIWSFWHWVKDRRLGWAAVFFLCVAASLGIKWNIVFLPIILVPWLLSIRHTPQLRQWFKPKKLFLTGGIGLISAIIFLIALWPPAWAHPIRALWDIGRFYVDIGVGGKYVQPLGFVHGLNFYPIILFLVQMPEIVMALLIIGIVVIFWKKGYDQMRTGYLLMLWLAVPLVRYGLPGVNSYNGIRQIMEVLPAVAVIAGVGAEYMVRWLYGQMAILLVKFQPFNHSTLPSRQAGIQPFLKVLIILSFLPLILKLLSTHPNENVYFNSLVGGLSGAYRNDLVDFFATNGNIYRQGANYLNTDAEKNANVAILDGRMFALSPIFLRNDISISPYHFSAFDRKGEYILFLPSPLGKAIFSYEYVRRFLRPVYEIKVDGTPILAIYKNDQAHLNSLFAKETTLSNSTFRVAGSGKAGFIDIDVGKETRVARILLKNAPAGCQSQNNFSSVDEVVSFMPESPGGDFRPAEHNFGLNEKRDLGGGRVEYLFPAERARRIRIFLTGDRSCFRRGTIEGISEIE